MTGLQKFDTWITSTEKDKFGTTFAKVKEIALESGFTEKDIDIARQQMRVWLVANEGCKKAQKSRWGRFFLNWLRHIPYNSQSKSRRPVPSKFTGETRIKE